MKLFIARHGEASFDAATDRERPLTTNGITATETLRDNHISELKQIKNIWSSDLKRAQETAAVFATRLGLEVAVKNFLSPDIEPERVLKKLQELDPASVVLIVSHQPLVGELVSVLCEGNRYAAHPYVTSEIVIIECEFPAQGMGKFSGNMLPV